MPTVTARNLTRFAEEILLACGVPEEKASLVARTLVAANLRGVDSHGVQLIPDYVAHIESGNVDARACGRVIAESAGCLLFDGENTMGQWVANVCCGHAVRLAREYGIGMVLARDSSHFGAAAWWAQQISSAGHLGIVMCNASPIVPPWQAKEPRIGTNPICVSVPGPWLLDMATTTVAGNRIWKALAIGQETIPPGWAMDSEGRPTTSTQAAVEGLLMPLGGYKGSGLGMLVEILCGVLGGGAVSEEVGGTKVRNRRMRTSQMYMAIEVERFMPVMLFRERLERLVASVKSAAPSPEYDEVLVSGDPERRIEALRERDGIPIDDTSWRKLAAIAARLRVTPP